MIYLLLLLIIVAGVVLDFRQMSYKRPLYRNLYWISFLLLALVPGLSYRVGIDIPTYMREYREIPAFGSMSLHAIFDSSYREPLWVLFNSLCRAIFDDFAFMHTVLSLLFNATVFYFVAQHTNRRFTAIVFYFFGFWAHINFGALREGIAMIFVLFAIDNYLKSKNVWKSILIAIPAIFFHKFAFVPVFLVSLADSLDKHKILALFILGLAYIGFNVFFENILIYMWESSQDFYEITDKRVGELNYNILGSLKNILIRALPPIVLAEIAKRRKGILSENHLSMLYMCAYVGLASSIIPLLMRIYFYFMMVMGVVVANLIDNRKYLLRKYGLISIYVMVSILWMCVSGIQHVVLPSALEYRKNVNYNAAFLPYHSVFTMEEDPIREGLPRR